VHGPRQHHRNVTGRTGELDNAYANAVNLVSVDHESSDSVTTLASECSEPRVGQIEPVPQFSGGAGDVVGTVCHHSLYELVATFNDQCPATARLDVGDEPEQAGDFGLVGVSPSGDVEMPSLVRQLPGTGLRESDQGMTSCPASPQWPRPSSSVRRVRVFALRKALKVPERSNRWFFEQRPGGQVAGTSQRMPRSAKNDQTRSATRRATSLSTTPGMRVIPVASSSLRCVVVTTAEQDGTPQGWHIPLRLSASQRLARSVGLISHLERVMPALSWLVPVPR